MLEWLLAFGYAGIFVASFISSASIIFPVPGFALVFGAGAVLDPLIVAILAAIGSALGELVGYGVGYYGNKKVLKKDLKKYKKWFKKYYTFFLVIAFAATPLPDDVLGLFCGAINYNIKKFFAASLIGKFILNLVLVYSGSLLISMI